jgi:PAP2 superfamily
MKRPYFFEIFAVFNLILIQIVTWRITRAPLESLPKMFAILVPVFIIETLLGVAIRLAIQRQPYATAIRSRGWLLDSARLILFNVVAVQTYGWIKVTVPLLNRKLYDDQLRAISRAMFFNHSPNVFFVELFSDPPVLRAIDWSYAYVFLASINIATIYFLSDADRKLRLGFMNSNTLMWIVGAWIYLLVPSLGPAYHFPDVWLPLGPNMTHTHQLLRLLMANYQSALRGGPVNVFLGIGAFPSLHVAFEFLVWLWLRRVWKAGALLYAVFTVIIFIGSLVTGWHYLIDAIAGLALAFAAYAAVAIRRRQKTFSTACLS